MPAEHAGRPISELVAAVLTAHRGCALTEAGQEGGDGPLSPLGLPRIGGLVTGRARWEALAMSTKRVIVKALLEVRIHRTARGNQHTLFDPSAVEVRRLL